MAASEGHPREAGLDTFEALGLSGAPLTVYLTLAEGRASADGEALSDATGLSIDEVDGALDLLNEQRFLLPPREGRSLGRPISPDIAMRRLVAQAEEGLRHQEDRLRALRVEVEAFVDDYRRRREEQLALQVEVVTQPEAIVGRIESLNQDAAVEILSFITHLPSDDDVHEARPHDAALLNRGVAIRALYLGGSVTDAFLEHTRWFVEQGAQIRTTPTLPMQMIIIDGSVAVVPVHPDDPATGVAIVRTPGVVEALRALFDSYWDRSDAPVVPRASGAGEQLNSTEMAVLRLLSRGVKDEALARHLGISVRTVRRIISEISTRLEARSRFELAVKAGQHGYI